MPRTQLDETYPGADLTADECQFAAAMLTYQRQYGRRFPAWREVLRVAKSLGYRKVAPPEPVVPPSLWKLSTPGPSAEIHP